MASRHGPRHMRVWLIWFILTSIVQHATSPCLSSLPPLPRPPSNNLIGFSKVYMTMNLRPQPSAVTLSSGLSTVSNTPGASMPVGMQAGPEALITRAIELFGPTVAVIDSPLVPDALYLGTVEAGQGQGVGARFYAPDDAGGRKEYLGEFHNGRRHGVGMMLFDDQTCYEGEWEGGRPNGHGVEKYPNGAIFTGQFCDDARHGLGTYIASDGDRVYAGHWQHGEWDGSQGALGPDAKLRLEEAMRCAQKAQLHAARLSERLDLLRRLKLSLPPDFRGFVSELITYGACANHDSGSELSDDDQLGDPLQSPGLSAISEDGLEETEHDIVDSDDPDSVCVELEGSAERVDFGEAVTDETKFAHEPEKARRAEQESEQARLAEQARIMEAEAEQTRLQQEAEKARAEEEARAASLAAEVEEARLAEQARRADQESEQARLAEQTKIMEAEQARLQQEAEKARAEKEARAASLVATSAAQDLRHHQDQARLEAEAMEARQNGELRLAAALAAAAFFEENGLATSRRKENMGTRIKSQLSSDKDDRPEAESISMGLKIHAIPAVRERKGKVGQVSDRDNANAASVVDEGQTMICTTMQGDGLQQNSSIKDPGQFLEPQALCPQSLHTKEGHDAPNLSSKLALAGAASTVEVRGQHKGHHKTQEMVAEDDWSLQIMRPMSAEKSSTRERRSGETDRHAAAIPDPANQEDALATLRSLNSRLMRREFSSHEAVLGPSMLDARAAQLLLRMSALCVAMPEHSTYR